MSVIQIKKHAGFLRATKGELVGPLIWFLRLRSRLFGWLGRGGQKPNSQSLRRRPIPPVAKPLYRSIKPDVESLAARKATAARAEERRKKAQLLNFSSKVACGTGVKRAAINYVATAERVLSKLPTMNYRDLLKLWRNAIRLSRKADQDGAAEIAEKIIQAIETEWQNRGTGGFSEEHFSWPSTTAAKGGGGLFDLPPDLSDGMLSYLEYRVGRDSEPTWARQALLERVFTGVLPPVFPAPYMREWGTPGSPIRLQKTAECLAAFVRNAKRRNTDGLDDAIGHWEQDLAFLHDAFYQKHLRFSWPISSI